jgi:hypothetical protein
LVERREERPTELTGPADVEHRTISRSEGNGDLASAPLGSEEGVKVGQEGIQAGIEYPAVPDVDERMARALPVPEGDPSALDRNGETSSASVPSRTRRRVHLHERPFANRARRRRGERVREGRAHDVAVHIRLRREADVHEVAPTAPLDQRTRRLGTNRGRVEDLENSGPGRFSGPVDFGFDDVTRRRAGHEDCPASILVDDVCKSFAARRDGSDLELERWRRAHGKGCAGCPR